MCFEKAHENTRHLLTVESVASRSARKKANEDRARIAQVNYTREAIIDPKHTIKSPNKKHPPQGEVAYSACSFDAGSNYATERNEKGKKKS